MARTIALFALISLLFLTSIAVHAAALPVPANVHVIADDRAVVLVWDGDERAGTPPPQGVTGYLITWGDSAATQTVRTAYRRIELQPLTPGHPYTASVQSVDAFGTLSAASPPIAVMADSSRVDALRQQMTGFFDDFNLPMGAPDERKWNTAFSQCNGAQSGFFINSQFHVHTMVSTADGNCDRGQTVVRPRNTFDFTGRTGTISFDFDGEFRRDQWYLDLTPTPMDITGQISIEGGGTNNPGPMLRFHQNGDIAEILVIDSTGLEHSVAKTDWNPFKPLDWAGLSVVQNVRRHWQLKISQSHADWFIDGVKVLAADYSLPFSKATVLWNEFSYNTPKANERYVTGHWDNFGFDGPAPSVETHNYRADTYDTVARPNTPSYPITIPDSLVGAAAQRLMYTIQMSPNTFYAYNSADHVTVNGQAFPMPKPVLVAGDPAALISVISPYSQSIILPSGLLSTGSNSVAFACASCAILNVHAEFDFAPGSAPGYTQPPMLMPAMPQPGPGATINSINGQWTGQVGQYCPECAVATVKGAIALNVEANEEIAMIATGKNIGIASVDAVLDGAVIQHWNTNGTPRFVQDYVLDTTQLTNGRHHLELKAVDTAGNISIPDYFDGDAVKGGYYPLNLNVQNSVAATPTTTIAANTPTATAMPTSTPTMLPTDTATPEPTATAVATDTALPADTATPLPTATSTPPVTTRPIGVRICFTATGQCSYWPGIQVEDVSVESYP